MSSFKSLLEKVAVEVGFGGKEGITLDQLWSFVHDFRSTEVKVDPIFSGMMDLTSISNVNINHRASNSSSDSCAVPMSVFQVQDEADKDTEERVPVSSDEERAKEVYKTMSDSYRSWFWTHLMAFSTIGLGRMVVKKGSTELEECSKLKDLKYRAIEDNHQTQIRVVVKKEIQDRLLFGRALDLPEVHRNIVTEVAKSREMGTPQALLCRSFGKSPKSMFPIIKKLIRMGILARAPGIFEKGYTFNVLHRHFAHRNEVFALCTQSGEPSLHDSRVKSLSAKGFAVTLTMCLSKQALSKALEQSNEGFLMYEDLADILGIDYQKVGARRRFRRLINSMHKKQYVDRCRAITVDKDRKKCGLKLIKPYRGISVQTPQAPHRAVGKLEYGVPIEHQIYSHIVAAGDDGITSIDLRRNVYDMDRKIFEVYANKLTKEPENGSRALVYSSWDFVGKLRFLRYFTPEAFDRKQLKRVVPESLPTVPKEDIPVEDVEVVQVDSKTVSFAPNLVSAAREECILRKVSEKEILVYNVDFHRLVEMEMGSERNIDRKTLARTVDRLVAEGRIGMLNVKVPKLDGVLRTVNVLLDRSLTLDNPRVSQFISQLREDSSYKLRTLTPTIKRLEPIDWQMRYDAKTIPKATSAIKKLLAIDTGLHEISLPAPAPIVPPVHSNTEAPVWTRRHQRQGFVRSSTMRMKLLHLALLDIIHNSTHQLHKQRTISTRDIFPQISLQSYLSLVTVRNPTDELYNYTSVQENMLRPTGSVPNHIHRLLFDPKNGFRTSLRDLLSQLAELGLLFPLTNQYVDEQGIVEIPQRRHPSNPDGDLYPYYHLPDSFDLRTLLVLDNVFTTSHTYSLVSAESAAAMWSNLQIIITRQPETIRPHENAPELKRILGSMTLTRSWSINYSYTIEQRNILESYIDEDRGTTPSSNWILCQELARRFKMWPSSIRNYFQTREASIASHKRSSNRIASIKKKDAAGFSQLAEAAILPRPKRQCTTFKPRAPPARESTRGVARAPRRIRPTRPDLDNILLHLYAIAKFRAKNNAISWIEMSRLMPDLNPDYPRRRMLCLLKYSGDQIRAAELLTKWRIIYSRGIATGELQEKFTCPDSQVETILVPSNPRPSDPESYLPDFLPISGYNLQEQLEYFLQRSDLKLPEVPQAPVVKLPNTVEEVYKNHQVIPVSSSCILNGGTVLISLSPQGTIPRPTSAQTNLDLGSEMLSRYELLYTDLHSLVAYLDLAGGQSFSARFSSLSIDEPATHHQPFSLLPTLDISSEVAQTAIKMILLAPRSTTSTLSAASFLSQFDSPTIARASQRLNSTETITKLRIKGSSVTKDIKAALDTALVYAPNRYRPTDKFLVALSGAMPFFLFKVAKLAAKEIFRISSARAIQSDSDENEMELSPPISPFIGPGSMVALLTLISDLKLDLIPKYSAEVEKLVPNVNKRKMKNRDKLRGFAFRNDFDVHVAIKKERRDETSAIPNEIDSGNVDQTASRGNGLTQQGSLEQASAYGEDSMEVEDASSYPLQDESNGAEGTFPLTPTRILSIIDSSGPDGIPFTQLLASYPDQHHPRLIQIMASFLHSTPPEIYRVGMDVCRLVTKSHSSKWMVCVCPTSQENDLMHIDDMEEEREATMVIPYPWLFFDGSVNERAFPMYANAALSHIVKCPGISMANLLFKLYPLVTRSDLYFLLAYLKSTHCITTRSFIQPEKPTPFSPRQSFQETTATASLDTMPHHHRGITCFWPTADYYAFGPDLSKISMPPRNRPGRAVGAEKTGMTVDDGDGLERPVVFSEVKERCSTAWKEWDNSN